MRRQREGTRAFVGPFTALWFAVFMIPYFLWVREGPRQHRQRKAHWPRRWQMVVQSSGQGLRNRLSLASYLGSSMLYRDALNGLYGFGGVYAKLVLGWEITQIGVFGIVSGAGGHGVLLDRRQGRPEVGPKPVIIRARSWS